ncbi:regulatory protein GemA [Humitalea sp. 24SJ18S-53]|uniref:regulatory protein GemA n=1 Tax=Humitalea sp. 24SJ18S-53 TaxID=3422307 RepID=UPI003D666E41
MNPGNSPLRRARLAQLHLAAKALRLDEDAYRDVLERVTGSRSAATLGLPALDKVVTEFKRLGFKPAPPRGARPASHKPQVRMIRAIWRDLSAHVEDVSEEALRAFCRRQSKTKAHPDGIDAPEFLDSVQANRVIEGLRAWLARERAKA